MLSDNIRKLLTDRQISYSALSRMTGIAKSTLQRYATGTTNKIPLSAVEKIEHALMLRKGELMGWEEPTPSHFPSPEITDDVVVFPVIGDIAAGYDEIAVENWTGDTVSIPTEYLKGRERSEFFVLRVVGDSMYPLYIAGDRVLILKQSTLNRSGDVGAVLYEDECATLKKIEYVHGEDWMKLIPLNPAYPPKTITGEQLEHCRVIGIPRMLIRDIEE